RRFAGTCSLPNAACAAASGTVHLSLLEACPRDGGVQIMRPSRQIFSELDHREPLTVDLAIVRAKADGRGGGLMCQHTTKSERAPTWNRRWNAVTVQAPRAIAPFEPAPDGGARIPARR